MEYLPSKPMVGHQGAVLVAKFNKEGNYCVSGGRDKTLRLWNPHKGTFIKSYTGHGYEVTDVDLALDNSRIASCGGDRNIFLWDVSTGRTIRKLKGHDAKSNCIIFSKDKDNSVLISGSEDSTVKIWDLKANNWDPIQTLSDAQDSITSLAVSDYEILTASVDGSVRTYDIRAGKLRTDYFNLPVASLNISHDNNCYLASTVNSTLHLFDKASGQSLNEYKGHCNESIRVQSQFSHDDAYVLSGSEDGRLYCWDLLEETKVQAMQAHTAAITTVAVHPRDGSVLTGSLDESLRRWVPRSDAGNALAN